MNISTENLVNMCINKTINVEVDARQAFKIFVHDFQHWWPAEYTWSQDSLKEIRIGKKKDELCTEMGPNGFRCDWGQITEFVDNESIKMKWQIGPNREPVPNPELASDIEIMFEENQESSTKVTLKHQNFENHGEGSEKYREMMDSNQGWDYIFNCYKEYCENETIR